jgi:hypothetical protein
LENRDIPDSLAERVGFELSGRRNPIRGRRR